MRNEALIRMVELDIWDIMIKRFKKDESVMMSEIAGYIYELDEEAKKAVEEAKSCGLLPYHVIKSELYPGYTVYDVLHVSDDIETWHEERRNSNGFMRTFCWMPEYQSFEYGDIEVNPVNGGLKRIG